LRWLLQHILPGEIKKVVIDLTPEQLKSPPGRWRPDRRRVRSLRGFSSAVHPAQKVRLRSLQVLPEPYATLIPFFYKGLYHGQMGWDWGFKASCEMEVAVVDRNKKVLRCIKIRFGGAPIKSVRPVLNEFFKPKRVNIGKAKMPKQDPICGRIGEKVT
jgi:hypothetical protein